MKDVLVAFNTLVFGDNDITDSYCQLGDGK